MGIPSQMAPDVRHNSISTVKAGEVVVVLFICVLEILLVLAILCYVDHCTHAWSYPLQPELMVL